MSSVGEAEHGVVAELTWGPFRWTQTLSLTLRLSCSPNPSGGGAELKSGGNHLCPSASLCLSEPCFLLLYTRPGHDTYLIRRL